MRNFWDIVKDVIHRSEILLEVLDARMVEKTRNTELEEKITKAGKQIIYVITKCDLVPDATIKEIKQKLFPCVVVSSPKHHGMTILRDTILRYAKSDPVIIGVVGYPNTGKSSLINALAGRHSAPVSIVSGYTRAIQLIKVDNRIRILDTPGVIPFMEKDVEKHVQTGTIDFTKVKDPEGALYALMEEFPGVIEKVYSMTEEKEKDVVLEKIAIAQNRLLKGGTPDTQTMARVILRRWQKGELAATGGEKQQRRRRN